MIRITDLEQKLLVEQIFGESCGDLYKPESFSEWEAYENHKQDIYETLWNCEQTFWDIYEMAQRGVFSEAAPTAFADTGTKDVPDVARKQVTISKQMAYLGLPQVPPKAAAGFLANNMVSSNPDYYRYIGKGLFGALQDRHQGKQPTNWVNEIRYILQGKPQTLIIDPVTIKPVPRLGAVTNRPVKQGVPQTPPAWNEYAPKKASAFQGEDGKPYHGVYIGYGDHIKQLETKVGQPIQLTAGRKKDDGSATDVEPQPILSYEKDAKGNNIMGPDGKPKTKIIGYTSGKRNITVRGYGQGRGEIGADLSPPVDPSVDPQGNSYLGSPGDPLAGDPSIPPGARGYKPQGFDSSKALQRQFGQYKYYMMQNPQLFDRRLIRVLMAKQQKDRMNQIKAQKLGLPYNSQFTPERGGVIPTELRPLQKNVARTSPYDYPGKPDSYGMMRRYEPGKVTDPKTGKETDGTVARSLGDYRRMFYPDPNKPDRKLLSGPEKRPYTDDELIDLTSQYERVLDSIDGKIKGLKTQIKKFVSDSKASGKNYLADSGYQTMKAELVKLSNQRQSIEQKVVTLSSENPQIRAPKQVKTGTFGNQRVAYTPEEEKEIIDKGTLNGKDVKAKDRSRFVTRGKKLVDEKGKATPMPTTGAVRSMVLPNNYELTPAKGNPIIVSDNLRQLATQMAQTTDKAQRSQIQNQILREAQKGKPDDKVYAKYFMNYGLQIQKNGTILATDPKRVSKAAMQTPWTWALTDQEGNIQFVYTKDQEKYDIPLYLPGVIDSRKPGNPTAGGGWDAAPSNAPEIRPYRDADREARSIHGSIDPNSGQRLQGWHKYMQQAANKGVQFGISELLKEKFERTPDINGNVGKRHLMYNALLEARQDIINNAYLYFQYNLANGKALDFQQNPTGRIDVEYTKKTFKHLYAACKQFDNWLKQPSPDGQGTNGKVLGMYPGASIFDLTFAQLNKMFVRLEQYTRIPNDNPDATTDYERMYQTKIQKNYIKNDLNKYRATDFIRPATHPNPALQKPVDPNPPKDRSTYSASGKKVDYNYLDVNFESLMDMFDEARRQYWMFAAKDMVKKMYKQMTKEGSNIAGLYGDSLDAALSSASGGSKGKGGTGPTRNSLSGDQADTSGRGQQIIGRLTPAELWNMAHERQEKINRIAQELASHPGNGGLDNAAEQLAIIPIAKENNIELEVMQELQQEAEEKKMDLDSNENSKWFMDELSKRIQERKAGGKLHDVRPSLKSQQAAQEPEKEKPTPEQYLKTAPQEGLDNNKLWSSYASKLTSVNPMDLDDLMTNFMDVIQSVPDSKGKEKAERTVTFHVVQDLMNKVQTMTSQDKKRLMTVAKALTSEYRSFYDLAQLIPQIVQNVQDAPAAAPQAPAAGGGLGLRGRLRNKTA